MLLMLDCGKFTKNFIKAIDKICVIVMTYSGSDIGRHYRKQRNALGRG